jgi:hypothetical protein
MKSNRRVWNSGHGTSAIHYIADMLFRNVGRSHSSLRHPPYSTIRDGGEALSTSALNPPPAETQHDLWRSRQIPHAVIIPAAIESPSLKEPNCQTLIMKFHATLSLTLNWE